MIDRDEIEHVAKALGINSSNVQRDYLYGWLLAGLFGESAITKDRLVLKGGNAFRKGYFVNTRFSGDLDFAAPNGMNPGQLLSALNESCRMIQSRTGVQFDLEGNKQAEQRFIGEGKTVHKFTLYFRDFYGKASKMTISLRVDVTEFGRLYLPTQLRKLIHPYTDQGDCASSIQVVSLEEALADKLKCLLQRQSSKDLFDLVYSIFVNNDVAVDKKAIVTTFLRKTIFGPSPAAALSLLLSVPFDVMRFYWEAIICGAESRMDFTTAVERFTGELRSLFSSFQYGDAGQLAFYPAELRSPIMDAGRTKTLLELTYDGVTRLVEPYSLAFKWLKGGVGQEYLYVWDQTGGRRNGPGIKALKNWKISSLANTDITFEPRYEIELAKAGEYGERTTFASVRSSRPRSGDRNDSVKRYRVRCAYCDREFDRSSPSTAMRAHQDSFGNPCRGRRGYRV